MRTETFQILVQSGEPNEFFTNLRHDPVPAIAEQAFMILVERQDRPTIEKELTALLGAEQKLRSGEVGFPDNTPLDWIGKIKSVFAWDKLRLLRERALGLGLERVTAMFTDRLAQIDRPRVAKLIRQQLDVTPGLWRHYYQALAIEQERMARAEKAQRTPFDAVLRKLRRSTSADKLLVICEGPTDKPVIECLLAQVPYVPEVLFDFVGGWPALVQKDPHAFLRGAKEAMVIMDADNGRKLNKKERPFTQLAHKQRKRLQAAGVDLRVLERYGIENYFPQHALEAVLGRDLTQHFPVPETEPLTDRLSENVLSLPAPEPTRSFYTKGRNAEVARHIDLERDLAGTDLHTLIHEIAEKARRLAQE